MATFADVAELPGMVLEEQAATGIWLVRCAHGIEFVVKAAAKPGALLPAGKPTQEITGLIVVEVICAHSA